ncbi:TPA: recombination regulator RecX [Streptococcus equi subsp. zooepidemicus]|uniref:Regulatory protein RecX n=3 Tax=Streptococcus equi subsp. zooepidemicus TaxID=40041 RepID=RECX_STREM|nr:recombination regulator RecX [Streptococcus equi]B4U4F7.1 RecName: Full=Regulatory protein RecX [Streptococcus equi subsp. zooepidemicus MGCS10565]KIS16737.1 recombination regulator RecX [Streptococcus equi subsp. zooepidemicus Sz4is]ACG62874.1 regulatory protein recX [Streptococcus equi subsp. zooepidemicus MGCS10565]AEJ25878.1 recombination regulator RecX [Streptococcus equi subsp. zooepidemicus ATCC 35246]AIA67187.1 recombinase RecX [Streptococcus equi subsp. zooepidemicus CY]EQB23243.1
MKISQIEKKKHLYLIKLDNGDNLTVTEDTIIRFMLSKHMVIDSQQWEDIKSFAQFSYGKSKALGFIAFQQRSQKQVQDYLLKHQISPDLIPSIIDSLKQGKWIDDQQYVDTYVRQNSLTGDKGPLLLKQKLMLKGIASQLIEPVLAQTDFSSIAQKAAEKIYQKYQHKLPSKALTDKIIQGLLNKGFSYDLAKGIVSQLSLEQDSQHIEDLLDQEFDKLLRKYSRRYDGYQLKQKLYQALYRKGYDSDDITTKLNDYF